MRKYYVLAILAIAFLGIANAATVVTPDNSNIQYTGRIDFSDPMAPMISDNYSYLRRQIKFPDIRQRQ